MNPPLRFQNNGAKICMKNQFFESPFPCQEKWSLVINKNKNPNLKLNKQDQFDRLPDDVVLVIINKLIHIKTLIRFSLVSKRYAYLVYQTDSLFVDMHIQESSFHGRVGGALSPTIPDPDYQKLSAILHGFQQIKYLHLHFCLNPSTVEPLEGGSFCRYEAVFGSHFEFGNLLIAISVHQSKTSVDGGNDDMHGLTNEHFENAIDLLKTALVKQDWIKELLVHCKMLENVVFTDNDLGGKLTMGKEQIARLQGNQADLAEVCGIVTPVPTLDLPKSGYTMNDVMYVKAFPVDKDTENVGMIETEAADQGRMDVAFLDGSDMKKWEVFYEAVRQTGGENMVPMHVTRFPYSNFLQ